MHQKIFSLLAVVAVSCAAADEAAVRAAVAELLPDQSNVDIGESPLPDILEVAVGTQVFYVSADGRYVLGGPLIKTANGRNLSEQRVARARRQILDAAADIGTYNYPSTTATHSVTVVTDIDCPYCRRLHTDLPQYAAAGISVNYIMLPRAGKGSASYTKTVNAACADDPEAAITAAMNGASPGAARCAHPIDEHMALARKLGVTSTPTIVLEDGRMVLGQKKAADLLATINEQP